MQSKKKMIFMLFFAVFLDVANKIDWRDIHLAIGWPTASILPNSAYLYGCSAEDKILTTFLSRLKVGLLDSTDC